MLQIPPSEIPSDFQAKTAIMHVVDKPLEEMTVAEICQRAGISRSRFYELFESKFDIGFWYLTFAYDVSLGKIGVTLTWREGVELCLDLVGEERDYFAYTTVTPQNNRGLFWLIQEDRRRKILDRIEARGIAVSRILAAEIDFYVEATDILLRAWVNMKDPWTSSEYADVWIDCVPKALYEAFA